MVLSTTDKERTGMQSLLLSFVLTCASAATISSRCRWGPPYWCSSLENARECQATKHCVDTVWKHQVLKQQSTETCTYCQLVVGELKSLLTEKATEDEIATVAAKACNLLPNPDWQDQCKGIVIQYTPELIEMLNKDLSTMAICATVGFCEGFEDYVSPYGVKSHSPLAPTAENSTCQDCTKFFQDVQQSVTSKETVDELLQLLNQTICSRLNGFEDLCMNFFKDNLPSALQLLADQVNPNEVCRIFGFCTTQENHFRIPMKNIFKENRKGELQYRGTEECDACKEALGELVSLIRDRTTQQKIMDEVETVVCGALGGLQDTCKQLVEEYAPMAFEFLVNELDPNTFCEYIGMCPVPTLYNQVKPAVVSKPKVMTGYVQESELCVLCETVMQELDNLIQDNTTLITIEDFIDKICNKLSSEDLQKQCTAFVQEYGQLVLGYLAKSLDPKTICTELSLCKGRMQKVPVKVMDDNICNVCVLAVTELENLVKNMSTDEIIGDLKQACNFLPVVDYKTKCNQYVEQYGTIVVQLLKDGTDPHSVCSLVKACTSKGTSQAGKMTVPILEALNTDTSLEGKMTVPIPEDLNMVDVKTPSKIEASTVCEVCNTVVYYVDMLLKQNSTEEEILALLKDTCSGLGPLKDECTTLVDQYGKQIIDMLSKEINPKLVCNELGLCNEKKTAVKIQSKTEQIDVKTPSKIETSTVCEVCNTVVYYVDILLKQNSTEEEILTLLKDTCSGLGPLKDECTTLVDQYGKLIIDMLSKEINPKFVCNNLGLCNEKKTAVKIQSLQEQIKSQVPCEVCTTAITVLKDLIGNQITREGIAAGLEQLCNKLPPNMQGDCDNLVVSFEPEIIDYILKKLSSGEICGKLGLCSADQLISSMLTPYDMLPLQPMQPAQKISANPIECEGCTLVINYVLKYIGEDKSKSKIKEALDKVCDKLPSEMSGFCKSMVDTYLEEIINYIIMGVGADKICEEIGFCSAVTVKLLPEPIHVKVLNNDQEPANPFKCKGCKLVIDYVLKYIGEDKTEEKIKEALDKACNEIPSVSSFCKSMVNQYEKKIIDLIIKNVGADEVCKEIKFCSSETAEPLPKPIHVEVLKSGEVTATKGNAKPEVAGPECEICELLVEVLEKLIQQNSSEAEIEKALETVCSYLPSAISQECKTLVDQYGPQIIQLLVDEVDPDKICSEIGLCTALESNIKDAKCDVCKFVVGTLDEYLKAKKSKDEIKELLKIICSKMPGDLSNECEAFVKEYADLVISLLEQELDPNQICADIKLCPKPKSIKGPLTCEACKTVCQSIETWLHQNKSKDEIMALLYSLCDVFPDTVTVQCKSEMDMIAPKIIQMLQNDMDPDLICPTLQLCGSPKVVPEKTVTKETDDTLYFHPKSHPKMLGTNKCMWGPAYWCASKENALSCDAVEHCERHAWN